MWKRVAAVVALTTLAVTVQASPVMAGATGLSTDGLAAAAREARSLDPADGVVRVQAAVADADVAQPVGRHVCYQAYVQGLGWDEVRCDTQIAGTIGEGQMMEAIAIGVSPEVGSVCYQAHIQRLGWDDVRCNTQIAGLVGEGYGLDGLAIGVQLGGVCYQAHLQGSGWEEVRCNTQIAGTTNEATPLEAIAIGVF
ncbi:hypothetical protein [Couchioplanes azureus]|uniref:hypothetical protein n=1 Tax=Couchioplanes caeruleus TaxID=56438 RepID=UPI00167060BB|nr:hypothetical protein [Couchioplanes caeruleus]GGQ82763.1 hypothetical protein GCM10010166_61170 [Couchioplanes caeruleus subsp. azureus]